MEKSKKKLIVMLGILGIVLMIALIVVVITMYNAHKIINNSHNDFNANMQIYR